MYKLAAPARAEASKPVASGTIRSRKKRTVTGLVAASSGAAPAAMLDVWTPLARLRAAGPLVHNITNYVVMNTTANARSVAK